ncbi:hypothetical protein [Antiquaquibacter soli]|uniref:DUF1707 domain-containing protein n=1 Tax=Antiquaquibacter soli TaxID=3064523 RepID=A0ABT9BMY4_9MICO|nr:hypothetical protein [Protaetiibacter sp. WY-16]MDO7882329.1 hypothetical protein [Protaetiibacter sp. WY-16]
MKSPIDVSDGWELARDIAVVLERAVADGGNHFELGEYIAETHELRAEVSAATFDALTDKLVALRLVPDKLTGDMFNFESEWEGPSGIELEATFAAEETRIVVNVDHNDERGLAIRAALENALATLLRENEGLRFESSWRLIDPPSLPSHGPKARRRGARYRLGWTRAGRVVSGLVLAVIAGLIVAFLAALFGWV